MALSKTFRLRKTRDIQQVFRKSKKVENEYFIVRIHWKGEPSARLSVVVSGKVSKRAVVRNRIRRRVTEFLRQRTNFAALPLDCIVQVKAPAAALPRRELIQTFSLLPAPWRQN